MNRQSEEEIFRIGYRLTECVSYLDAEKRKAELLLLLDQLNKLVGNISNEHQTYAQALNPNNLNTKEVIIEVNSFGYIIGRINLLKTLINSLIDKLNDAEKTQKLLEKEDEIIQKSKEDDADIKYFG